MALEKAATGPLNFSEKLRSRFKQIQRKRDRPFIVPTLFGLIFGLVVLLLLMMALGSANNVLYLFVFFLTSVALSAMVITNDNLQRVRLLEVSANGPVFADEEPTFQVVIANQEAKPSYFIEAQIGAQRNQVQELAPLQERLVSVRGGAFKRGYQEIPRSQISTTFPFGMLRSWKINRKKTKFLVYPARKGSLPFPMSHENSQSLGEIGLFRDLREYQSTDSPRRVDWRASLKHDKMLVKNFESLAEKSHSFQWAQTESLIDFELRLSQLTQWLDQAEKSGIMYSLEVGVFKSDLNRGATHLQNCLQYLARLKSDFSLEGAE